MQGASWISLFRRIPDNLHDGLILTLSTGAEVVLQKFVRLEPDYVILRGRMAGTQESGRVVVLPYHYLIAANITRRLTEPEVEAIFGKDGQAFAASMPLTLGAADATTSASAAQPAEDATPANGQADGVKNPAKPAMPSKAALLAKLRARLNDTNRGVAP